MTGPAPVAADLVQCAAGVIAARRCGDLAGAEALLASFDTEQARTLGFYLLADLALGLVRAQTGQSLDDLVRELTLLVAAAPPPPPG
ncbi:superoxide dismutase [Micromonospora sp. WMMD1076]|uniref:superoxide dismutase n=1 Tax=Micromonospora sp. WMMD1076 TaxID=3016103 RepID=UPI00249B31FA|nr:superoxide dismutase [Micromonospora sp. WMMD1076]WFF08353.1 superoxide dismutase [Micromonospora sp. WMMD1076]